MTDPLIQIKKARELIDRFSETTNDQTPALMREIRGALNAASHGWRAPRDARSRVAWAKHLIDDFGTTPYDEIGPLMHRIAAHVAAAERALEAKKEAAE